MCFRVFFVVLMFSNVISTQSDIDSVPADVTTSTNVLAVNSETKLKPVATDIGFETVDVGTNTSLESIAIDGSPSESDAAITASEAPVTIETTTNLTTEIKSEENLLTDAGIVDPMILSSGSVAEIAIQTNADEICQKCSCADAIVDCVHRDIRRPFEFEEWLDLTVFKPIKVDLSNNPLTTLSKLSELPIQTLNVTNCELEIMENGCFMHLPQLVNLDLSRNKLTTSSISRRVFVGLMEPKKEPRPFIKMRYLSLAYNDIHSLPQDLFDFMTELTSLDLSGNPLTYLDQITMAALSDLTKLKELKLKACDLEILPEGILRRHNHLDRLDLSGNKFTTVPAVLNEATNLVYLNLDGNPIGSLGAVTAISNLTKLQELHMCRLSKLHTIGAGALGGLENLVSLHLCHNPRLNGLNEKFLLWKDENEVERWPLLTEMYLNNNNLSLINSQFLDRWDQLISVDFTNNPYVCDCNSQWMVDVLIPLIANTAANGSTIKMICKYPQDLHGLSFTQLHQSNKQLTCPSSVSQSSMEPNAAILLGVMIGVFVTFPLILVVMLSWKKGYFAKCRGKKDDRFVGYYEVEIDAF